VRNHLLFASFLLLGACSEDPARVDQDAAVVVDAAVADASDDVDATPPSAYQTLIEASWSLQPGDEGYFCATRTLDEDLYVSAIRPVAPDGTHHTVVSIEPPDGPDNPGFDCGVEFGQFYASGVGTGPLVLPEGVGLIAQKGQQVRLNLHLYNAGDNVLTGRSGIEIIAMAKADVVHEARIGIAGPMQLTIPGTGEPVEIAGEQPAQAGRTAVALFPHMHQTGTHFKTEVLRGEQVLTLWDREYQFESQEFELIEPFTFQAGDMVRTTCTYVNTTGNTIHWGDSSDAEMCFTVFMQY
jgi:hypothetical protein